MDFQSSAFPENDERAGGSENERPPPPPDVPPLTPDSTETNPDFIKAEMSFYTTPHTEEYRTGVYDSLKAIQTQCLNDFNTFCPASTLDPFTRKPIIFLHHELHTAKSVSSEFPQANSRNLRSRRLLRNDHSPDRSGSSDGDAPPPPPPRPNDKDDDEEHHRPDDHDHEDDRHHHHGPRGPPHHHVDRDTLFAGSLGYGLTGDTCMNLNFKQLSPDCQSSISELRTMRESFWREDNQVARGGPHRHRYEPDNFWINYLAIVAFILACRHRQTIRTMRLIRAIVANPALAAQVEAETGENLSVLRVKDSRLVRVGTFVCTFIFAVVACHFWFSVIMGLDHDLPPLALGVSIYFCVIALTQLRSTRKGTLVNLSCVAQPIAQTPMNSVEAPLVATNNAKNDPEGGSEAKSSTPITSFSTTSTTTTSTSMTTGPGILAAIRSAFGGLTAQSSADGAYSALSTDGSVHGQGVVVTGVPVPARREDGSNWN